MKKIIMLLVLSFSLFISVPGVQANKEEDQPQWESLIEKAHNIQAKHSRESAEYTTVRNDFLKVFTKGTMMEIFMEHLMPHDKMYRLASTDFSPYIIPSLEWASFHVDQSSKNKVILLENQRGVTTLSSPQRILRKITLTKTDDDWKISHLDWIVEESTKTDK